MKTSELIALRKELNSTLNKLINRVDKVINNTIDSEGVEAKFAGMDTKDKIDYVMDIICDYGDVTIDEIRLGKKSPRMVKWAKIACYILTDYLHVSQWDIQNRLNYSNHNSVIFHRNAVRGYMQYNDNFNDVVSSTHDILKRLGYEK